MTAPAPALASADAPEFSMRQVGVLAIACGLAVCTIYYHQPLLPQMAAAFDRPAAAASIIATVTQLGYATGLLTLVPLGDRMQPRTLIMLAIVANAIALLGCAAASSFAMLGVCSFLVGVSGISAQVVTPAVTTMVSPAARGRVIGTLLGGLSSGLLLARTVSGVLGQHIGWRPVFVLAACGDLVLLALVSTALPRSTSLGSVPYRQLMASLVDLLREEKALRLTAATAFLMFAAFSALWSSLAGLLARPPYAFGPAAIGAFGLVSVIGIALSSRIGALADRLGSQSMFLAGALTIAAGFVFIAASGHGLTWLIIGMVLLDFGNRAGLVANQSRLYVLRQDARSRLNTVFIGSYFLGGSVGAAVGGWAAHYAAWWGLAGIGASFALAAALLNTLASTNADKAAATAAPETS